jgi:hypothetical protein
MVLRYIKNIAHRIYFPVLQGHVMELQQGLPFAAISIEKSPLLACIQGRVLAKDDDYFATVWARGTDNQTDIQHSICKSENHT